MTTTNTKTLRLRTRHLPGRAYSVPRALGCAPTYVPPAPHTPRGAPVRGARRAMQGVRRWWYTCRAAYALPGHTVAPEGHIQGDGPWPDWITLEAMYRDYCATRDERVSYGTFVYCVNKLIPGLRKKRMHVSETLGYSRQSRHRVLVLCYVGAFRTGQVDGGGSPVLE